MQIIGNIATANKFYIINSFGSIEWVPNLNIAKKYTENPFNKEWFDKPIYATNEDLITDKYGRVCLKSQIKDNTKNFIDINKQIKIFKEQTKLYIENTLNEYSKSLGYNNIYEILSWKGSTVKQLSDLAKEAFQYRDNIYKYHFKKLEEISSLDKENLTDLTNIYSNYIEEFPKYKKGE